MGVMSRIDARRSPSGLLGWVLVVYRMNSDWVREILFTYQMNTDWLGLRPRRISYEHWLSSGDTLRVSNEYWLKFSRNGDRYILGMILVWGHLFWETEMNFCQSYFDIILVARCEVISDDRSFRRLWKVIEYSWFYFCRWLRPLAFS